MTEQPGYVLEEAVKLFETLRRRMNPGGATGGSAGAPADDVWSQAVREESARHMGEAPECRYCPICRTVAAARESGPDVVSHVVEAGQSLVAAMREAVAAYERSRPPQGSAGATGPAPRSPAPTSSAATSSTESGQAGPGTAGTGPDEPI